MPDVLTIPQDIFPESHYYRPGDKTAIRLYSNNVPAVKTKITIRKNLFSFLMEGEKVVNRPGKPLRIMPGQFLMISSGRCLMTEKLSANGNYHSLLFFFDDQSLRQFFIKYPVTYSSTDKAPVVAFDNDPFIHNFLQSLQVMLEVNPCMQQELQLVKLEELLLYLRGNYPELLSRFQPHFEEDSADQLLQSVAEENCYDAVTVEELAFLCNMSLSTFKRKFGRVYGTSPNKWLLQKRMEKAAELLGKQEKPSEIYGKIGYENHSSFSQSFKQIYGVAPKDWQKSRP